MKLHILGASGSGVTTLGSALADKLSISYFDSDTYFWEKSEPPFTLKRDARKRNALIKADLDNCNEWIFGGSSVSWGDNVFPTFDLIVFLWVPPEIRMERLKQREFKRYGNVIFTDPERIKLYIRFIDWAASYDDANAANRSLKVHENWFGKMKSPILQIRGDYTTDQRIELIMNSFAQ